MTTQPQPTPYDAMIAHLDELRADGEPFDTQRMAYLVNKRLGYRDAKAESADLLTSCRELHDYLRAHGSVADTLAMLTRSHDALARAEA